MVLVERRIVSSSRFKEMMELESVLHDYVTFLITFVLDCLL